MPQVSHKVYKLELLLTDTQKISIEKEAQILCVQVQMDTQILGTSPSTSESEYKNGKIFIWYECDPSRAMEEKEIWIRGTGQTIDYDSDVKAPCYIGTVQLQGGSMIFHVFEVLYK